MNDALKCCAKCKYRRDYFADPLLAFHNICAFFCEEYSKPLSRKHMIGDSDMARWDRPNWCPRWPKEAKMKINKEAEWYAE
jgi:hypothetical protein